MKIGILSMQKILNYGSFLQALSLKMLLEDKGHDVFFLDIIPGRRIVDNEVNKTIKWYLSKLDKQVLKRIDNYLFSKKMDEVHRNDYLQYLNTNKYNDGSKYDLVIIGSDEVFNATIPSAWGFSTQLFGNVSNAKRVATYAACCGSTTYEDALRYGIVNEISLAMRKLSDISVRDMNTCDFVYKILGYRPQIHVDPVFLSDYDKFIPDIRYKSQYLLVYAYGNRINSKDEIEEIQKYADSNALEIISVGMQHKWCKHNIVGNAFELLSYVKGASCIVTDTFHGTVFSIKYNKPFATIVRSSNTNKLEGLLMQFGLLEREVKEPSNLGIILNRSIDFDPVNKKIEVEANKALSYLETITR